MKPKDVKPLPNLIVLAFSGWRLSWKGLINNQQGEWWLIAQLILITAHLLPPWPSTIVIGFEWPLILTITGISIILLGLTLATRALMHLGVNLSPLPDPKPGAKLVTTKAYSRCRHPLYQALIVSSIGTVISLGSFLHLLLLVALSATLKSKAMREERQLQKTHSGYRAYLSNTPAIFKKIPFLDWRE